MVKIFESTDFRDIERQVNYWLQQSGNVKINHVSQSSASFTKGQQQLAVMTLCIFYEADDKTVPSDTKVFK